jgi:hypothetical protein
MAPVEGITGEYILPENGFSAPEGKVFKCWEVDGVEMSVGASITVTADVTVKAVWEEISGPEYLIGDLNSDEEVNIQDSLLLFQHSLMPDLYPLT